ncbi:MAG: MBL fold metallo-hydrolase, partial [Patescibacteria group bacterium]|nr:MBL fold metallo-hydrolase [Patescibacteria group bacterium]
SLPDGLLHVYFLDVGQGDAILIQTPNSKFILVDGGPDDKVLTEMSDVMPFFEKKIDLLVLTHAHADHINGLVPVLKRYDVEKVLITGAKGYGSYYEEFTNLIAEKEVLIAESGQDFDLGNDVYADVVYPVESILGKHIENTNNASIVFRLIYGGNAILLTGDAEIEVEKEQIEAGFDLTANVMKAGHHGSRTASSAEYLEEVQPETVVIQCGEGNKFSHPHSETLQRFDAVQIYRNDRSGRVHLVFDQDSFYLGE